MAQKQRKYDMEYKIQAVKTEDFQSAVDFLSVQDNVDRERIGIIMIIIKPVGVIIRGH